MTIPANGAVVVYDDTFTAISDASAIAAGAFNAGTISQLTLTDIVSFADLVLDITFATLPTSGSIKVYRRDMNIDGAVNTPTPSTSYKQTYLGSFNVAYVTTQQRYVLMGVPISPDQEFYIENATNVATTGTTVLKVKPKTYIGKVV